ncbi:BON domain-containing protein [Comamonas sp. GB3 AK4-5]|uniref:BON domain-containing protein n=1 Tax=Comamonas sp. GB3 AK4-5 TaxID=3231487 RepID=UPI00351E7E3D
MSKPTQRIAQIIAVTALAFGLAACDKPAESQTAGQKLDEAIANTEQAAGNAAAEAKTAAVDASTAALNAASGATDAAKVAAADIKDAAQEAGTAVASVVDAAAITAAVHAGLLKDAELRMLKIQVAAKDGVVTLSGEAPNQGAKDRAGEIAKAVQGVSTVQNDLTIKAG